MATVARTQTLDVPRPRVRLRISRVIFLVLAVIVTAVALAPFILTVSGSFKTKSEILDWPPSIIPHVFEWQNYVEVWTNSHYFPQWILNSALLAGFHLLVYLAICSAAGYAFARLTLPLGLASFQGLFGVNWNWVLAGAMFNAVPIIILVIFFQKYFIRSAASSAVKG